MQDMVKTIEWTGSAVRIIDQTRLPHAQIYLDIHTPEEMIAAIRAMRIRGAPALGVAGAYGVALGARCIVAVTREELLAQLRPVADALSAARPTAVNLSWGVKRVMDKAAAAQHKEPEKIQNLVLAEARRMQQEDIYANRRMGFFGAALLPDSATVLTHCNAGALATAGYGTALGVMRAAKEMGKELHVYVGETRPLLQGTRLTAWELMQEGIPATLITDSMAGHIMHTKKVDAVIVGADRIAANGDVANKIGTYVLSVLAKENSVPFYVVAPLSSFDLSLVSGDLIPIEEREPEEVTNIGEIFLAPEGVNVANPAFDVTPARYVTAIITDKGVVCPPYGESLLAVFGKDTAH